MFNDEQVLSVGEEIDSYCTSCKLVLAHQIVAFQDDKVEQVICKTCGKQHKYRPQAPKSGANKGAKTPRTARTTSPTKRKVVRTKSAKNISAKWEEMLVEHGSVEPKAYAMDGVFEPDDMIEHPTFGRGFITDQRDDGKIEVFFKAGKKLLVSRKKSA